MGKLLKREFVDESVLERALDRFRLLFDRFDTVAVSFSGGKDSTVCLNLALQVARERGRLPLDVVTFDEEAIHPETVEYIARVAALPEVRFRWYCLPVKHRNACSRRQPYWHPWHPDERHLWVRELPEGAITSAPWFRMGMTMPECVPLVYGPEFGMVAQVRGIRAQESIRRLRSVSQKLHDNWITDRVGNVINCSPIFDWRTEDVWLATQQFGWDYNQTYDVLHQVGTSPPNQRVCPPYGEEPLGGLHQYAECGPHLWHAMIARVPGAATAARYARTELYGFGGLQLPPGKTWRSWLEDIIALWPAEYQAVIRGNIATMIRLHNKKTACRDIPDEEHDPISGASWRFFCEVATRGDLKNRRMQSMQMNGDKTRKKTGQSLAEALAEVGR